MDIATMYFIYFVVVRDWSIAVSRALTSQSRATLSRGNTNENCATFDNGFCSRAWQVARGKESKHCIAYTEAAFRSHLTVLINWNVKHINTYIWYNPACKWIVIRQTPTNTAAHIATNAQLQAELSVKYRQFPWIFWKLSCGCKKKLFRIIFSITYWKIIEIQDSDRCLNNYQKYFIAKYYIQ